LYSNPDPDPEGPKTFRIQIRNTALVQKTGEDLDTATLHSQLTFLSDQPPLHCGGEGEGRMGSPGIKKYGLLFYEPAPHTKSDFASKKYA
jgi:hypothetical protein